jgi:hypothetical protein
MAPHRDNWPQQSETHLHNACREAHADAEPPSEVVGAKRIAQAFRMTASGHFRPSRPILAEDFGEAACGKA